MTLSFDARTVLIPIDMQQGFDLASGPCSDPGVEAKGLRLLSAWRGAGLPLVHVRHDSVQPGSPLLPGQPGNALRAGFEPRAGEPLVTKSVNAAFIGTDLDLRLRRMGVEQVLLFGLTTDMCVSTTARVSANLGYRTLVVGDASACFELVGPDGVVVPAAEVQRAHLATLHNEFARVVATSEVERALTMQAPAALAPPGVPARAAGR